MQTNNITRRTALGAMAGAALLQGAAGDWVSLFDGKTLNGWKPNESAASWKVTDCCLTANGPRSHLFYAGPVRGARCASVLPTRQIAIPATRGAREGLPWVQNHLILSVGPAESAD